MDRYKLPGAYGRCSVFWYMLTQYWNNMIFYGHLQVFDHSPLSLNARYPAAIAAAYSAATSLPGLLLVILYAGRAIVISSGLPQKPWSWPPSPTYVIYTSKQRHIWFVLYKLKLGIFYGFHDHIYIPYFHSQFDYTPDRRG